MPVAITRAKHAGSSRATSASSLFIPSRTGTASVPAPSKSCDRGSHGGRTDHKVLRIPSLAAPVLDALRLELGLRQGAGRDHLGGDAHFAARADLLLELAAQRIAGAVVIGVLAAHGHHVEAAGVGGEHDLARSEDGR